MDCALILDKPAGLTSHDVVARVRRLLGERSVGHLGTLDPGATGVLPMLTGRLTRLARFFQARDKEYEGEIIFGQATDTYDASGDPVGPAASGAPSLAAIEVALPAFRGHIVQQPPPYSAKKTAGRRAYVLARQNQPVHLAPVHVEVAEFAPLGLEGQQLRFRVRCSAGTYVRSLAHDLGQALGLGAHLGPLRRTRCGEFTLARAVTLDQLAAALCPAGVPVAPGARAAALGGIALPAAELLPEFPAVTASPDAAHRLRQGRTANLPEFSKTLTIRVFLPDGVLLAIARRVAGSLFQPQIVFP
ncbi:MAG: tRNA pseudouridine(55) synthase TruB [Terriglobales bacterium]